MDSWNNLQSIPVNNYDAELANGRNIHFSNVYVSQSKDRLATTCKQAPWGPFRNLENNDVNTDKGFVENSWDL